MSLLLLTLPPDVLRLVFAALDNLQSLAALRVVAQGMASLLASSASDGLWRCFFSSTRPWRRCGEVLTGTLPAFERAVAAHGRCVACMSAKDNQRQQPCFPPASHELLQAARRDQHAAWATAAAQPNTELCTLCSSYACTCDPLERAQLALNFAALAIWLTPHGARCWGTSMGTSSGPERNLLQEACEARACVLASENIPWWRPMVPPRNLELSPKEWAILEGWLGENYAEACLRPPGTGSFGAKLLQRIRASLLVHQRLLNSGDVLLFFARAPPAPMDVGTISTPENPEHVAWHVVAVHLPSGDCKDLVSRDLMSSTR